MQGPESPQGRLNHLDQQAPERPPPVFPAMPAPAPTGEERVDAALDRLGALAGAPVTAHVAVFEEVHQRLQDVLTSVDEEPSG